MKFHNRTIRERVEGGRTLEKEIVGRVMGEHGRRKRIILDRKYVTRARVVTHLRLIGSYDGHLN